VNISPSDAQDLLLKWQSEHSRIEALFSIVGVSGHITGHAFFEDGMISVVSFSLATIRFKFSDVSAFEYIESREWPPPPKELFGSPPISSLILHLPMGSEVALHELASDMEPLDPPSD
jgi:hypothetical protein